MKATPTATVRAALLALLVVNVNTASTTELAYLPAVGPALAERIAAGRPYSTPEDLLRVKGIGPAKLGRIRQYVTTTGRTTLGKSIRDAQSPEVPK